MSLFMTADDVTNLLRFATYSAASKLNVPNASWEDTTQLEREIDQRNSTVGQLLRTFKDAYLHWFRFWADRDARGVTSGVVGTELADLNTRVANRDATRDALIATLKSL